MSMKTNDLMVELRSHLSNEQRQYVDRRYGVAPPGATLSEKKPTELDDDELVAKAAEPGFEQFVRDCPGSMSARLCDAAIKAGNGVGLAEVMSIDMVSAKTVAKAVAWAMANETELPYWSIGEKVSDKSLVGKTKEALSVFGTPVVSRLYRLDRSGLIAQILDQKDNWEQFHALVAASVGANGLSELLDEIEKDDAELIADRAAMATRVVVRSSTAMTSSILSFLQRAIHLSNDRQGAIVNDAILGSQFQIPVNLFKETVELDKNFVCSTTELRAGHLAVLDTFSPDVRWEIVNVGNVVEISSLANYIERWHGEASVDCTSRYEDGFDLHFGSGTMEETLVLLPFCTPDAVMRCLTMESAKKRTALLERLLAVDGPFFNASGELTTRAVQAIAYHVMPATKVGKDEWWFPLIDRVAQGGRPLVQHTGAANRRAGALLARRLQVFCDNDIETMCETAEFVSRSQVMLGEALRSLKRLNK